MPAEVVGILRENATYGEKETLNLLKANLPKEYCVYVESPIRNKRDIRYPDFIVLTNYGVIVLEVKDWVQVERADPHGGTIRTRQGETRHEQNPVSKAREFAIALSQELNERRYNGRPGEPIPWSYAAVLINLPSSVITQLREPWGENFVFGRGDLDNTDLLKNRLKQTFPVERMRSLIRQELDFVRATIFPVVEIQTPTRPPFILDQEQEKLVAEPTRIEISTVSNTSVANQVNFFDEPTQPVEPEEKAPDSFDEELIRNTAVRLVRGVAGSGKTLVLTQRARYLAALYPEWNIAVISFNDELVKNLKACLKGIRNIKTYTFHKLCSTLLGSDWRNPTSPEGWIESHLKDYPAIKDLTSAFLAQELTWIRDIGLDSRESYLQAERRGRGKQVRLTQEARMALFDLREAYYAYLRQQGIPDWADVPYILLEKLDQKAVDFQPFDMVLVDEAQDFAPSWIKVIKRLIKPQEGMIFMADDPTQSIYRYFSWREKGIPVVGRTHRLRVPYRNTYEIYQLAFEMVRSDELLQQSIGNEGQLIDADFSPETMRHGPRPLLQKFNSTEDELAFIRSRIEGLLQNGCDPNQIAVLNRRNRGLSNLQASMRSLNVNVNTYHAYKGLEFDYVFLCDVHETFQNLSDDQEISEERRLLYMAMTRARQQLFLVYQGQLPKPIKDISKYMDMI